MKKINATVYHKCSTKSFIAQVTVTHEIGDVHLGYFQFNGKKTYVSWNSDSRNWIIE